MVALTEKLNLMALRFHLGLFIFNPFGVEPLILMWDGVEIFHLILVGLAIALPTLRLLCESLHARTIHTKINSLLIPSNQFDVIPLNL